MYPYDDYWYYSGIYGYYPTYIVRDDEQAAANAAANAPNLIQPAGCATATASGNVMTITVNGCDGPMNLKGMSGTVQMTFMTTTTPPSLTLTSQDLRGSDGTEVNLNSTATYTVSDTQVALTTESSTSIKTAQGATITRQPSPITLIFTQGSQCFTTNGQDNFTINGNQWSGVVSDFTRCQGQCPQSGTFTLTPPNGDTVTITYDGSTNAQITRKSGRSLTVSLMCE
jgi:hypothetical protein